MEYVLFLDTNITVKEIGDGILKILNDNVVFGESAIICEKENDLSLYCDMFTMQIDNFSDSINVVSEELDLDLKIELYMNLDMKSKNVIEKTICFVGNVMKEFFGDMVLLSNGDLPIILRNKEEVIVDNSKLSNTYPFELLDMDYSVKRIQLQSDKY